MRLKQPRIKPLTMDDMSEDQREATKHLNNNGVVLNIFRTLANAPKALKRFNVWGGYILSDKNDLPAREREIVILRVGYLCRSGYEWTQHHRIGLQEGLSAAEIERIKAGAEAEGWTPAEAALIRCADDLVKDFFVADATWSAMKAHWSDKQCMDAVMTVGQYTQVSMILNSFGVQLDEGQVLDPDLDHRG